jgi:hypothetical protein
VEDLGIEAQRETQRERYTHTYTYTYTTFQRERKETRETKTCRKGRSLVVSFAKALRRTTTSFNIVCAKKTHVKNFQEANKKFHSGFLHQGK